jgi:hypothetical protein
MFFDLFKKKKILEQKISLCTRIELEFFRVASEVARVPENYY